MEKILLTGGNGFIGKNILEQLGSKYVILSPRSSELDLTDEKAVCDYLQKNSVDIVLHCASVGIYGELVHDSVEKNLRMFLNLIKAKKFYKKLINLGSGAEYDKTLPICEVKEEEFGRSVPKDSYGFYKYVCAKIAENSDFIIHLRIFGVYGKYEDYNCRFISYAICRTLLNKLIKIKQNVFFDYIYIDDLVRIIDLIIQKKDDLKYNIYNVGRGEKLELSVIAEKIINQIGKVVPVSIDKPGLNNEYTCDIERLKKEIGEFVFTDFEDSIKKMSDYYENNLQSLNKEIWN